MNKVKKHLITSALPYINGVKHLGNLIGSILPADVYARYLRQQGDEVLYICGTDDHGAPAEIAAYEKGESIEKFCDEMHELQNDIYNRFDIEFDYFGRTSTKTNQEITQLIFNQLDKNGYILEKTIKQYFSAEDDRFLPDRFIIGICPCCGYTKARGDQCDGCSSLLDPVELIGARSSLNEEANLELIETKHLFLDLPKLKNKVEKWSKTLDKPSKLVAGTLKKWLNEDLQPRCITRDLKWGIPVPKAGYEDKVFYVWFDAPNGYISMTMDWAKLTNTDWQTWWKKPEDVQYSQFMAKDNLSFHAIFWPAILLGTDENWTMVDELKGFNWLTYEGGKFSTSQQRGVFMDVALDLFPSDYWRYYLLANAPESSDSDFDFTDFIHTINTDLADNLGNFISRVLALVEKYFDSTVPEFSEDKNTELLKSKTKVIICELNKAYTELRYRDIVKNIRSLWTLGNEYITEQQPWKLIKQDQMSAAAVLVNCLHLIRIYAITASAVIPKTARKIADLLSLKEKPELISIENTIDFSYFQPGYIVSKKIVLVEKIAPEIADELKQRFSGQ